MPAAEAVERGLQLMGGVLLLACFAPIASAAASWPVDVFWLLPESWLVTTCLSVGVYFIVRVARTLPVAPAWVRNPLLFPLAWIALCLAAGMIFPSLLRDALVVALAPLGFWLMLLVHELGHAAAVLLVRFELYTVQVGPLLVDLRSRKAMLAWSVYDPSILHGAVTHHVGSGRLWQLRRMLVLVAGPVANLATAALLLPQPGMARVAAMVSIWIAVANLFPLQIGVPRDGRRILDLLFHPTAVRLKERILRETEAGKRPRDWSVTLEELMKVATRADQGWTLLFAFARALDTGRLDVAEHLLARGLRASAGDVRTDFLLQGAILRALVDAAPRRARELLVDGITDRNPIYHRLAEAAVLFAEGQLDAARAARDDWLGALHTSESPNLRKGSNEWAMDRLESLLAVAPPVG